MTPAEFRRLALSLPHSEEREHMNHPDFRVGGKIFATLSYPDKSYGMVKLFPDQQADFVAAHPKMFVPVKGAWGAKGCTHVLLKAATQERVREALSAAWENTAPKELQSGKKPSPAKRSSSPKRRGP
jgi:hypothetical protein